MCQNFFIALFLLVPVLCIASPYGVKEQADLGDFRPTHPHVQKLLDYVNNYLIT